MEHQTSTTKLYAPSDEQRTSTTKLYASVEHQTSTTKLYAPSDEQRTSTTKLYDLLNIKHVQQKCTHHLMNNELVKQNCMIC